VKDYLNVVEGEAAVDPQLSPRENEILQLLAEGFSSREIADKLIISPSTVHTHRTNLMRKLGLGSRHELIQYARQRGLL
jgi:DNA-binding CsgD family transcriptional regulator